MSSKDSLYGTPNSFQNIVKKNFQLSTGYGTPLREGFNWFSAGRVGERIGVRMRLSQEFVRFLKYLETQLGEDMGWVVKEVNESAMLTHFDQVERAYRQARQRNRRPSSRTGQLGRVLEMPDRHGIGRYSNRMLSIDWNLLDYAVKGDRGFPYWRSVEYGYRRFTVDAGLFLGLNGRFTPPMRARDKEAPRLMQRMGSRGVNFDIEFEGYGFITPHLQAMRKGPAFKTRWATDLRERMTENSRLRDVAKTMSFFIGGGGFNPGANRFTDRATGLFVGRDSVL